MASSRAPSPPSSRTRTWASPTILPNFTRCAGKHEAGFGVALAEGADAFDQIHQLAVSHRRRRGPPSMSRPAASAMLAVVAAEISKQIMLQCSKALLTDRQPCCHRMAAALDEQPLRHRGANCGAEIDTRNRAQRACAIARPGAARLPRDDAGGPAKALDQATGNETDDTFVPGLRGDNDDRTRWIVG